MAVKLDYATLMPLHNAAQAALEADADPKAAIDAFAAAFPKNLGMADKSGPAHVFLSVLFVAASGSAFPGALQTLLDTGLVEPSTALEVDPVGAPHTLMSHSALRALHPAQVEAFIGFVAQDLVAVMANPKGQTAWSWYTWATAEQPIADLCSAFGLFHNLKEGFDPDRDGPFSVLPEPRDSAQRARAAATAIATLNTEG